MAEKGTDLELGFITTWHSYWRAWMWLVVECMERSFQEIVSTDLESATSVVAIRHLLAVGCMDFVKFIMVEDLAFKC
jgi:hypothetical protein